MDISNGQVILGTLNGNQEIQGHQYEDNDRIAFEEDGTIATN